MQKRIFLALLILAVVSALIADPLEDMKSQVKEKVLDNGLRILVLERHNNPTAAFVNYVDAGSVNEFIGQTGAAHFLEHLAFKGTHTVGTNNYKKEAKAIEKLDEAFMAYYNESLKGDNADSQKLAELEAKFKAVQEDAAQYTVDNEFGIIYETHGGVGLNAYTSLDQTVYHLQLPSNKYELWCAMEADRIANPVYRQFYKEREVIQEERLFRYDDNPSALLTEEFAAAHFKAHHYRDPVIGHQSEMSQLMRDDIINFYNTYYHPGNMTISIVGDVDAEEIFETVEDYFGDIPVNENEPEVRTVEPAPNTAKNLVMYDEAMPFMMIGYHVPEASHEDLPAIQMLSGILGDGRMSRLYNRFVTQEENALYAGCFVREQKYPTNMVFYLYPKMGLPAESLLVELDEELARIIAEPPTQEELDRVLAMKKSKFIFGLADNEELARQMATHENVHGDWRHVFDYIKLLENVTPEDVSRVADKYLSTPYRTIAQIKPPVTNETAEVTR